MEGGTIYFRKIEGILSGSVDPYITREINMIRERDKFQFENYEVERVKGDEYALQKGVGGYVILNCG